MPNLGKYHAAADVFRAYIDLVLAAAKVADEAAIKVHDLAASAWCAWNAVVYQDHGNPIPMTILLKSLDDEPIETRAFVQMWIKRKKEEFSELDFLFGNFEFRELNGDLEIKVTAKMATIPDGVH